ncbi:MAG TPA: NUDIX hydrolase [Dongiaceae bacterium]|nr:NUDIX hydrolase [Dongiaceae bacterium]
MITAFKVIVSGFIFNNQGQLLVIRRSLDEESFPGMLAIPGGTTEVDEQSGLQNDTVEHTLIREVKEETDIDIAITEWMESSAIVKDTAKLYLFFKGKVTGNEVPATSPETPEVFWANLDDISPDECTPSLKNFIVSHR